MGGMMHAQGATEYLVLLAVVLVIALVSISLLGFFPGMAGEAQETESKIYWQSASPIAITEWAGRYWINYPYQTVPYLRIRNVGTYPIRITKVLGGEGHYASQYYDGSGYPLLSAGYYLSPGEEAYFGHAAVYGNPSTKQINLQMGSDWLCGDTDGSMCVMGLTSNCGTGGGTLTMPSFGFEYIVYIDGQSVTKKQIGSKPLVIKCGSQYT